MNGTDGQEGNQYSVPPVVRAFRLLRHIAEGHSCDNVNRTAKTLGISRTTLIRLLQTLVDERAIEPLPGGAGYRLGTGLVSLASQALHERDVVNIAYPVLQALSETLELSAYLGMRDGASAVYLAREAPNSQLVSNIRIGSRLALPATTIGRVLLAYLDADARERLFGEVAFLQQVPEPDLLRQELEQIRRDGLCWSLASFEPGIGSCAAPVFDRAGAVIAAINVVGPEQAFTPGRTGREQVAQRVRQAAEQISRLMGYRP